MRRTPLQTAAEPCRASLVVLDFDGTLTDADAHAPAFHEASRQGLARRLGWDDATSRQEWTRALAAVTGLPPQAAWIVNGYGVCPAAGDPYLVANSVNQMLLTEHLPALDSTAVAAEVAEVHRAAYERVPPPFRPDARDLLEALGGRDGRLAVVTNSHTQAVERRLDALSFAGRSRVIVRGGASKFSVCGAASADVRFTSLPKTMAWPELGRPIHLRRGKYFDVLRGIWDETATDPASTLVAGDVFELDLALPAALGTHVHLVTRASSLPHEVLLARQLARGDAGARLGDIVARFGK